MVMHDTCGEIDKYRQVDVLLYDGVSLDSAFFLAIFLVAPCTSKYLREKAYRG